MTTFGRRPRSSRSRCTSRHAARRLFRVAALAEARSTGLVVEPGRPGIRLTVDGPEAAGPADGTNLVVQPHTRCCARCGPRRGPDRMDPAGAGLGGGSSERHSLRPCRSLADVPETALAAAAAERTRTSPGPAAWMRGRGEVATTVDARTQPMCWSLPAGSCPHVPGVGGLGGQEHGPSPHPPQRVAHLVGELVNDLHGGAGGAQLAPFPRRSGSSRDDTHGNRGERLRVLHADTLQQVGARVEAKLSLPSAPG